MAISKNKNSTVFQKTLALNDFYIGGSEWEYPMGHIQMLGKTDGEILKGDAPKFIPKFILDAIAGHSIDFWLCSEDLPDPNNRLVIQPQGQMLLQYTPNNQEGHKRLTAKLKSLLKDIGCHDHLFSRSVYLDQKIQITKKTAKQKNQYKKIYNFF